MIPLTWTLLLLSLHGTLSFVIHRGCINETFCDCSIERVVCTDNSQKETLTVGLILVEPFQSFTIRGFHKVILNRHFLHATKPATVILTNITHLHLRPTSFLNSDVVNLEISHVKNLTAESSSLFYLKNITRFKLYDVTSSSLLTSTFLLSGPNLTFTIEECRFGDAQSNAIHVEDFSLFHVKNTRIDSIGQETFNLTGLESGGSKVKFLNVSFSTVSASSFTVHSLYEMIFAGSNFGTISSDFVSGREIGVFNFSGNNVNHLDFNIFDQLEALKYVIGENNFTNLYNTSLPLGQLTSQWSFRNNVFRCDCDSLWLLNVNSEVLQNNYCTTNASYTARSLLADLEPVWRDGTDSECLGLQRRAAEVKATESTKGTQDKYRDERSNAESNSFNTALVVFSVYAAFANT